MTIALPAVLNIADGRAALPALVAQAREGSGALEVDAGGLANFDTAAIATLLELRRIAQAAGRDFSVRGAPPAMVDLAGLYGVAELLGLAPAQSRASAGPSQAARLPSGDASAAS